MERSNKNKEEIIFLAIFAAIFLSGFSFLLWTNFCENLFEKDNFSVITLLLLVVVSVLNLVVISFVFYRFSIKDRKEIPKDFNPFIYWQYDIDFFREFKVKEFKKRRQQIIENFIDSIRFYLMFPGVLFLIPIVLVAFKKRELLPFLSLYFMLVYPIVMVFAVFLVYQRQTYFRVKRENLMVESPFFQMNSNGFVLNNNYVELNLKPLYKVYSTSLKVIKKYNVLCFEYKTSERRIFPNWEYGDTYYTSERTYYIPIPPSKVEEAKNMVQVLEKNRYYKVEVNLN